LRVTANRLWHSALRIPAGGSLYYTNDLEQVAGRTGIPLSDDRFCVRPDAKLHIWYGRRSQLKGKRGPCTPRYAFSFMGLIETIDENAEAGLVAAARKELAYLEQFGRPLLPFQREEGRLTSTRSSHRRTTSRISNVTFSSYLARLQKLSSPSFPYPPSRSPAEQRYCVEVARL
jgi:hypothetical protein